MHSRCFAYVGEFLFREDAQSCRATAIESRAR
jgi:hypothetical protein